MDNLTEEQLAQLFNIRNLEHGSETAQRAITMWIKQIPAIVGVDIRLREELNLNTHLDNGICALNISTLEKEDNVSTICIDYYNLWGQVERIELFNINIVDGDTEFMFFLLKNLFYSNVVLTYVGFNEDIELTNKALQMWGLMDEEEEWTEHGLLVLENATRYLEDVDSDLLEIDTLNLDILLKRLKEED